MKHLRASRHHIALLAAATALLMIATAPPAAGKAAAPAVTNHRLATYLAAHPGGQVINDNEISYANGELIVNLTPPPNAILAAPDCPQGWFCFYDRTNFGYPRGKLSSCGRQNLATWYWDFRIDSAHYQLDSGTAAFFFGNTPLFSVSAARRTISDAGPNANWANYVQRYC